MPGIILKPSDFFRDTEQKETLASFIENILSSYLLGPSRTVGQSLTRWNGDRPHNTQLDGADWTLCFFEECCSVGIGDDVRLEEEATGPGGGMDIGNELATASPLEVE